MAQEWRALGLGSAPTRPAKREVGSSGQVYRALQASRPVHVETPGQCPYGIRASKHRRITPPGERGPFASSKLRHREQSRRPGISVRACTNAIGRRDGHAAHQDRGLVRTRIARRRCHRTSHSTRRRRLRDAWRTRQSVSSPARTWTAGMHIPIVERRSQSLARRPCTGSRLELVHWCDPVREAHRAMFKELCDEP